MGLPLRSGRHIALAADPFFPFPAKPFERSTNADRLFHSLSLSHSRRAAGGLSARERVPDCWTGKGMGKGMETNVLCFASLAVRRLGKRSAGPIDICF